MRESSADKSPHHTKQLAQAGKPASTAAICIHTRTHTQIDITYSDAGLSLTRAESLLRLAGIVSCSMPVNQLSVKGFTLPSADVFPSGRIREDRELRERKASLKETGWLDASKHTRE